MRRTFTCGQTGLEKTGEKIPMTLVKAIGQGEHGHPLGLKRTQDSLPIKF